MSVEQLVVDDNLIASVGPHWAIEMLVVEVEVVMGEDDDGVRAVGTALEVDEFGVGIEEPGRQGAGFGIGFRLLFALRWRRLHGWVGGRDVSVERIVEIFVIR